MGILTCDINGASYYIGGQMKKKRFLVQEIQGHKSAFGGYLKAWELYWTDETGIPGPPVAIVYDKETLDILVQAPALIQTSRIAKQFSDNPAMYLDKREYKPSIYKRFQELMGRVIKKA